MSDEIKAYVYQRHEELESERYWGKVNLIIDEVKEKFGEAVSDKFVRYWCKRKVGEIREKLDGAISELNEAVEERKAYEVEGESVVFHVDKKHPDGSEYVEKYAIPFDELEQIWYDYSQHGRNLSGKNVLIEHGLKRETLALLRSRLGLTKDDNAIPQVVLDYVRETYGEEAVEKKIVEVTHRSYEDRYKKKFVQADKRETDRLVRLGSNFQTRMDALEKVVMKYEPRKVTFKPKESPKNEDVLNVFFSDVHFGNGNDDDIVRRFQGMLDYVVSQPHKYVNVTCLGDLGENFAPEGMHKGQIKHMSMHGRELTMFIVEVMESFLLAIHKEGKVVRFKGKGGNHDRTSEESGVDDENTMAWVIYEFIKRGLSNFDIEIEYFMDDITTFSEGGVHYIAHHGNNNFSSRKMEDVLWKNGDNRKHNVIIHGDRHNVTIKETKGATMIGLPAFAGKGTYDTKLDLHSAPGFAVVSENGFDSVDVLIKRLP